MAPLPVEDLEHVVTRGAADLQTLDGGRIFLTGGTGFYGRWLVESWLWARQQFGLRGELHILVRSSDRWASLVAKLPYTEGIHPHIGTQIAFPFPDLALDAVLHGAVEHGDPGLTLKNNTEGTRRILAFAKKAGASRFLFMSSGAVYGSQPPQLPRIPEDHVGVVDPTDPSQAYGEAKRASERLGLSAQAEGGLAFISARGFAFHGPGLALDRNYAIGNFLRDALGNSPIHIMGDGTPRRSYLYAADLAVWLWALLARGRPGRAYNVGSPEDHSILELAETVRDAIAPGREIQLAVRAEPGLPPLRYVPDTTRAMEELGLRPLIGLADGLQRTARWHREQEHS